MLTHAGLSYFGGQPILAWPPMMSASLAAVQWFLGVNGRALIVANTLFAALATFLFSAMLFKLAAAGYVRRTHAHVSSER